MGNFIKRLFTWWNGATLGTLLQLSRKGEKVGEDEYGNIYYREKGDKGYEGRQRRWVKYNGYADASRVPAEWHGWLHHMYEDLPSEAGLIDHNWIKEHHPNLTGTVYAYKPKGSLDRGGERDKVTGDYEAWETRQLMRKFLTTLLLASIAAPAMAENIIGDTIVLRALDKVTATTEDYTVAVGESLTYGSLKVDVKHCEKKPPEEIPATWAFVQIFDKRADNEGEDVQDVSLESPEIPARVFITDEEGVKREKIFSGWMLAERPAISALEHRVYDVWVIDCTAK